MTLTDRIAALERELAAETLKRQQADHERDCILEELAASEARERGLREALTKIAKGEGVFNRDQLTFANNVIDEAKETARAALAAQEKP